MYFLHVQVVIMTVLCQVPMMWALIWTTKRNTLTFKKICCILILGERPAG